jgi:UDP-N-acetylmuramate dehydrogenase
VSCVGGDAAGKSAAGHDSAAPEEGAATTRAGRRAAGSQWASIAAEIRRIGGVRVGVGESLAEHTTVRVGGPADVLAVAYDIPALAALIRIARASGIPYVVLGRGSDLVVGDAGIRGLVILCRAEGCRIEDRMLIAEAGLPLARAATVAQRAGLSGLEFGLAIPGTVGGAVWANAGAHGSDVASVLESVTILRDDGSEEVEPASRLGLAYRDSRFKHTPARAEAELILSATFRLDPASPAQIRARLEEIRSWRREHQPLNLPSAGSVFRNPPGDSAGRLIDVCGLKGVRVGGAAISEKHANFIVNEGGASAADIRRLAEMARSAVVEQFGVNLVYEVQFIGEWPDWNVEVE